MLLWRWLWRPRNSAISPTRAPAPRNAARVRSPVSECDIGTAASAGACTGSDVPPTHQPPSSAGPITASNSGRTAVARSGGAGRHSPAGCPCRSVGRRGRGRPLSWRPCAHRRGHARVDARGLPGTARHLLVGCLPTDVVSTTPVSVSSPASARTRWVKTAWETSSVSSSAAATLAAPTSPRSTARRVLTGPGRGVLARIRIVTSGVGGQAAGCGSGSSALGPQPAHHLGQGRTDQDE